MTTDKSKNFFRVSAEDFKKIPGSPIAYWSTPKVRTAFTSGIVLKSVGDTRQGMATSDNNRFLRHWFEVAFSRCEFDAVDRNTAKISRKKWFPYNKGGDFRKWYGNMEFMVNWGNDGKELLDYATSLYGSPTRTIKSISEYFKPSISWSKISSGELAMRYYPAGFIFDVAGCCIFSPIESNLYFLLGYMNSKVARHILDFISPTVNYEAGQIATLPVIEACGQKRNLVQIISAFCEKAKNDWDSYETSWDFQTNPLVRISGQWSVVSGQKKLIAEIYHSLRQEWKQQTEEMRNLEIENNRIFIEAYGLQDELSPEVPWNEITLTCNPWYRYGKKPEDMDLLGNSFYMNISEGKVMPTSKQEEDCPAGDFPFAAETEQRLLEDTIKEFISYTVGCMMGRYSPEKPGLILANQGSTVDDYAKIMINFDEHLDAGDLIEQTTTVYGPGDYIEKSFCGTRYHQIIDADGVLPILDEEWFVDDIVTQFKNFVAFIFGKENLTANMDFIESVLGKDIRKYFVKDFYKEHIQRYKKRPIYWLFSSPKGSFNALIYLHRYTPDTVSIVLNEYLRELMTKLSTRIKHLIEENNRADISNADKTRNLKQIDKYTAQLAELEDYERDVIFPLAQQKIAIDLDDGVKVNYCKFGAALKKIPGLEAKEE